MAEQTQAREQFVGTLQACMDSRGWHVTVDEDTGIAEPFYSEEEMNRAVADIDGCLREQGIDADRLGRGPNDAELRTMYTYDIDTYRCLVAQGVEMEKEPPSVDVYVEQGLGEGQDLSETWLPYMDPVILAMSQDEVAQLEKVCPERWGFAKL